MKVKREQPGPGQESVWDYPRPPALRACKKPVRIELDGEILANTDKALCILETSHPPTYYLPPEDIEMKWLIPTAHSSFCEWKGKANYYDILKDGEHYKQVAWTYHSPNPAYAAIKDHIVFYAQFMDACYVGDEKALPQPGGFYGGWVTSDVVGPFKGDPGTMGW